MYDHIIPTIEEKVRHMPHVYYFNLDHDQERREYMEAQFDYYLIHYSRISQNKYLKEEFDCWSQFVDDPSYIKCINERCDFVSFYSHVGSLLTHLDFFDWWLSNTNDDYVIIMEDDYDLSLVDYWHFTWDYLMENIPYDWDCIQMTYESLIDIPMFLHPRHKFDLGFGAMMLRRSYVKKLLKIMRNKSNKLITKHVMGFGLDAPTPSLNRLSCTVDTCIGGTGVTYRIPLFTMNYDFFRSEQLLIDSQHHQLLSEKIIKNWWKYERDNFSLADFFTYGKPYDNLMVKEVNEKNAFI
jgi:GR25 family glycosyltransferase involved in LPS biosynthesis